MCVSQPLPILSVKYYKKETGFSAGFENGSAMIIFYYPLTFSQDYCIAQSPP